MTAVAGITVAVIAKECVPGKVKTRLTPPLTPVAAAQLAQLSLTRTLNTVRDLPVRDRLLVMDGTPLPADAEGFAVVAQAGGGLDQRLAAICDAVAGPLLIIGMDTPQFSAADLGGVFADWAAVKPRHAAWMGPASDGGFWALALHRPDGALLRGVPMSTRQTGVEQLTRLSLAGLSVGLLPVLRDMDHFSDAEHIAAGLPGTDFAKAVADAARDQPAASGPGTRP